MESSIFPKNIEVKLGFDQIRSLVAGLCLCPLGKEKALKAIFSASIETIQPLLEQTNEMKSVCLMRESFPIDGYADATPFLARLEHERSWMTEEEMLILKASLEAIRLILAFLNKGDTTKYPALKGLAAEVSYFPYIVERVDSIINRFGKVRDSASPELARIRKEIAAKQTSVSKRIASILRSAQSEGIVEPDVTPSVRDGRIVIPVLAANKRRIKGLIHDESASGKTVFIEPVELVELNNEIRELEHDERREVVRILVEFADSIRPYLPELLKSYEFLGTIDFIRAKALFAIDHSCSKPIVESSPKIYLRQAVHPILMRALRKEGRGVVPLDIELNQNDHILLISGPNAGGKSVCLKTVGIAQYMLQCGFLPPVLENSEMGVFQSIFIDIGDEQSIENDLSTYSSHLLSMKHFLRSSNEHSLVLIDEFGSGTEPMAGGAIAEAILEALSSAGAFGVITTHYSNLKHFASSNKGVVNGAMLFDTGRIEPLFRLEMGKPGSSFAFEIARKIGLPEQVLKRAESKVGEDHVSLEKHLREISRDKRYWERKRESIRISNKKVEELESKLEAELSKLKEERAEIIKKAKAEAKALLDQSNRMIETTIRGIKEAEAEKERTKKLRLELESFKEESMARVDSDANSVEQKMEQIKRRQERRLKQSGEGTKSLVGESNQDQADMRPISKGDRVRLLGQDALGEVMEVNTKNAIVAFGSMITTIAIERLQRVSVAEYRQAQRAIKTPRTAIGDDLNKKRLNFKPDIDVRGQRTEEAIALVQDLVDEAAVIGYPRVRILHGKGNGILRQQIRAYLKTVPHVKAFADESLELGGTGITIVEF